MQSISQSLVGLRRREQSRPTSNMDSTLEIMGEENRPFLIIKQFEYLIGDLESEMQMIGKSMMRFRKRQLREERIRKIILNIKAIPSNTWSMIQNILAWLWTPIGVTLVLLFGIVWASKHVMNPPDHKATISLFMDNHGQTFTLPLDSYKSLVAYHDEVSEVVYQSGLWSAEGEAASMKLHAAIKLRRSTDLFQNRAEAMTNVDQVHHEFRRFTKQLETFNPSFDRYINGTSKGAMAIIKQIELHNQKMASLHPMWTLIENIITRFIGYSETAYLEHSVDFFLSSFTSSTQESIQAAQDLATNSHTLLQTANGLQTYIDQQAGALHDVCHYYWSPAKWPAWRRFFAMPPSNLPSQCGEFAEIKAYKDSIVILSTKILSRATDLERDGRSVELLMEPIKHFKKTEEGRAGWTGNQAVLMPGREADLEDMAEKLEGFSQVVQGRKMRVVREF